MSDLIDNLAAFFTQHPEAKIVAAYLGRMLGVLFALMLILAGLFLAFGNQKAFFYRKGSLVGKCWKAGWMLLIVGVIDLGYRFLSGSKEFTSFEIIFNCIPLVLLLFAQLYGNQYHINARTESRNARQKLS